MDALFILKWGKKASAGIGGGGGEGLVGWQEAGCLHGL